MIEMNPYLYLLQELSISPNFWCSEEYFKFCNSQPFILDKWVGRVAQGVILAPPVRYDIGVEPPCEGYCLPIWSDVPGFDPDGWTKRFLDYEFIYDPSRFQSLSGKNFSAFRKNIKKWPKNNPNRVYTPIPIQEADQVTEVLTRWLAHRNEEIHDDEVLLRYVREAEHRWGLFRNGELVGFNIWDSNWKYVNYRYCICLPEPFLSEYLRYLFYENIHKTHPGKLVNDGGSLGKPGLFFFKKRLNPIRIREVYSWKRGD